MSHIAESLAKQRRFKKLLIGLIILSVVIGVVIVPVENQSGKSLITNVFDGIWWSAQTVTSVGYGDIYPVTTTGKILGMILEIAGVLAFGLLVSMVTVALTDSKERYYRHRLNERLDEIEDHLEIIERHEGFVVKNQVETEEHA